MSWLVILGLIAVVWWQGLRIGKLQRRIGALEARGLAPEATAAPRPVPTLVPALQPAAPAPRAAPVIDDREPLLLDTPLPPDEREPLLLDTPLPPVSNDTEAPVAPPPPKAPRTRRFEKWLAENGLAWAGGGIVAFGLIGLVSFAAQQNWLTPQIRLIAVVLLSLALIGASEWTRRIGLKRPPGHPLVSALLAGAGVVALYATIWAAHGLYHFITWPTAAALLTLCAVILLGLSFLHGQSLAVLAIATALLGPAFASAGVWPNFALTLYICAVATTGFAVAWIRRWAVATCAAILGLYVWFAAALAIDDIWRALALLVFATLGGLATSRRAPLADEPSGRFTWSNAHLFLPTLTVCISTTFLISTWVNIVKQPNMPLAGPALVAFAHVALAAVAVRRRVIEPTALAIAIGGLVTGFAVYLRARHYFGPLDPQFFFLILFAPIVVVFASLGARPHRHGRVLVAASGAIGAALLYLLAAGQRPIWEAPEVWAPLFIGAGVLFFGALLAARDAATPKADWGIDAWMGGAVVLMLVAIESAFPPLGRAPADGAAAVLLAYSLLWRDWRATRVATLTAAGLAIAHALSEDILGATMAAVVPLWRALLVLAATAGLLLAAARLGKRDRGLGEALSSASLIVVLIGVFLALRWVAAGGTGTPLSPFTESALRAVALMAAGHVVMPRPGDTPGPLANWRAHALMGLGLLLTFGVAALLNNPWWGEQPARIYGPPILDDLTLAFAAPAALALFAASRLYTEKRMMGRVYAALGGLLAFDWVILEIRRSVHGASMAIAPTGVLEAAGYGLTFLATALAIAIVARMRAAKDASRPLTSDLSRIMTGGAWIALIAAAFLMLLSRHPWWGEQDAAGSDALATGLATLAQAAAVALSLALGRALSRSPGVDPTRFAAASAAALFAWSFGHAAIRWLYHGGAMDDDVANTGLEGFAHALWPLVFVLGASQLTKLAPGRDSVRAYLYDLQAIWAAAVWPALIFAALGLWLMFAPWWGWAPVQAGGPFAAALGMAAPLLAVWLSVIAPRVPHVRWPTWLGYIAITACIGHLLLAATLLVRWSFHAGDLNATAPAQELELWTYSGVYTVFGGAVVALGAWRNHLVLTRIGLAILFATFAKVFIVDTARLNGLLHSASLVALGTTFLLVAWATRQIGQAPRPIGPDDLEKITPAARRDGRHGRR